MKNNKILLRVKRDNFNKWFKFEWKNIRVQLSWDTRDGKKFRLEQYADLVLWDDNKFMSDLTKVLSRMAIDGREIFSLYEMTEQIEFIAG